MKGCAVFVVDVVIVILSLLRSPPFASQEMHGYLSGGTLASMIVGVTDAIQETLQGKGSTYANDPYILTPKIQPCEKLDVDPTGWGNLPRYDHLVSRWGIPHFMAYVNSRIVRRSMNLLGHTRVSYSEVRMSDN